MKTVYPAEGQGEVLTLEMAIARAIKFNLDKIIAETEAFVAGKDVKLTGLEALPSASFSANRVGRNNPGGSSSRSLQTGIQSLEPSVSTDQYRYTRRLDANWNLLDAGIAIGRARGASDRQKAAMERRRKVFEDVVTAVYSAYWRAAAAQRAEPGIRNLISQANDQIKRVDAATKEGVIPFGDAKSLKGTLLDKRQQLVQLQEKLMFNQLALKALVALPPGAPLRLDLSDSAWLEAGTLPRLARDEDDLHAIALLNRPEVREQFLNKSIAARNVQLEILSTFPGATAVFSANHDENSFLANNSWFDWTVGLTQSITKILTLPARYQKAKADQKLTDQRRQALIAAVMVQVSVSHARYHYLRGFYDIATETDENARQIARRASGYGKAGLMGPPQQLAAEIDAAITGVNRMIVYADAQEGYAQVLSSIGVDVWDGDARGMTLPEISGGVRRGLQALEDQVLAPQAEKKGA
jgi:outer membrane protein TolC